MAGSNAYVVVGASLAGAKAVEAARDAGYDGPLVLVGDEADRPYERPLLSKGLLKGEKPREKAYVHDEGWYAEHDVELRLGTSATAVDREGKVVALAGGGPLPHDPALVGAGGVAP